MPGRSRRKVVVKPSAPASRLTAPALAEPDLDVRGAIRRQHAVKIGKDGVDGIKAVVAAVKGKVGIMVADFNRERRDFRMPDVGWIGNHNIEFHRDAVGPVANREHRAVR